VAAQLLLQLLMLPGDRRVAVVTAPDVETMQGAAEPLACGLAFDDPMAPPGASPAGGEPNTVRHFFCTRVLRVLHMPKQRVE